MPRVAVIALVVALVAALGCTGNSDDQLRSLFSESTLALRQGDSAAALALARRGREQTDRSRDSEWSWRFRILYAEVLLSNRDPAEVLRLRDMPLPDQPAFAPLRARLTYLVARTQDGGGQLEAALQTATAAHDMAAGAADLQREIAAFAGRLLMQLGRWDAAEARLTAVAADAARANDRYIEAVALNVLGRGQVGRARYDQAITYFERAAALSGIADTLVYSTVLNNAGICYSRLGLFDRAIGVQQRAIASYEQRQSTGAEYAQALGQLGNTYVLSGDAAQGLAFIERALQVSRAAGGVQDATLWAGNLASAYVDVRQWDQADRYNEEAKRLWEQTRSGRPVYHTLNSAAIAAGRGQHDRAVGLYEEALGGADVPPSLVWDAHAGLAAVARSRGQTALAVKHFEAALAVIEQARSGLLKTDYKISYLTQLITFYQAYVETLLEQGEVERALEIADSSRGRVLAERHGDKAPARISAGTFRTLAGRSGKTFLAYWLTPVKSYLWVVTGASIEVFDLPGSGELAALVRTHQGAIANVMADPLARPGTAGDTLYRLLVSPAASRLGADAPVVIVADGVLHAINFETLPVDGPRRHYWIENAELQIAPSLASLTTTPPSASTRRPAERADSVLLIGNPTERRPEFPALMFAPQEMANITRHFGATRVTALQQEHASPSAYRSAAPERFAFVHFAAHATVNMESPLDSAVILSGPDSGFKLYARDVAEVPLRAEVVTVSACRSAGERAYSGEGLVGFAWAFLRAGSKRVIAGLWDVDDRSTADLMDRLYANMAAADPPASALRRAKLAFIAGGGSKARPFHWAPFQLFTVSPW